MATGADVLIMLRPDGGWVIRGDDFEGIDFISCEPLTQKEFEDGFAKFDAWQAQQNAARIQRKQEILDRLGLTEDEAKLLLS